MVFDGVPVQVYAPLVTNQEFNSWGGKDSLIRRPQSIYLELDGLEEKGEFEQMLSLLVGNQDHFTKGCIL